MESAIIQKIIESYQAQIEKLTESLAELQERNKQPSRSTEINELATALAKAQGEMKIAGLNAQNPFFKSSYADLAEIVKASRPALTKNSLAVIQQIIPNEDGQNILHTILTHATGQWIESRMRILPAKTDVQSLASYITYLRRYSYAAIVGVVSSDEDDDAEIAVSDERNKTAKGTAISTRYNPKEKSFETISKEQLEELEYELAQYPEIAEEILERLRLQSLADLPKNMFLRSIERIREIKHLRNEGK